MAKTLVRTDFNFEGQTNVYHGKVRDVYSIGNDILVMVATDRISAFDVILPKGIPSKGQVLNQIAASFLDATADIVPNWKLATPDPMVTVGKKCEGREAPRRYARKRAFPRTNHHPNHQGSGRTR